MALPSVPLKTAIAAISIALATGGSFAVAQFQLGENTKAIEKVESKVNGLEQHENTHDVAIKTLVQEVRDLKETVADDFKLIRQDLRDMRRENNDRRDVRGR